MNTQTNINIFLSFPCLESDRLLFREFSLMDSNDLFQIRSDDDVMRFMDTYKLESVTDAENFIKSINESFNDKTGINWAIIEKQSGIFIGYFGFWRIIHQHCRAEIGYALKPKFWNKGYMAETMKTMIEFGFDKLKIHSIEANVNPDNTSSIKLLEKTGFSKEAIFKENYLFNGKYIDSIIYSLLENSSHNF